MVNHILDGNESMTLCGDWAGAPARDVSVLPAYASCPDCVSKWDSLPPELRVLPDPVKHPPHYTWLNGIEVIDITENLSFTLGNVVKYVLRADHKGKPIEDLKKARWYLDRELKRRGHES